MASTQPVGPPPYTIDICATCVSEKPPKLPLREEVVSLGFEMVYMAQGKAEKAVQHEMKRNWKDYKMKQKTLKKRRFFKSGRRLRDEFEERRILESEIKTPHALSYDNYEMELGKEDETEEGSSDESSSVASFPLRSSKKISMRDRRRKQRNLGLLKVKNEKKTTAKLAMPKFDFAAILEKINSGTKKKDSTPNEIYVLPVEDRGERCQSSSDSSFSRDLSSLSTRTDHFRERKVEIVRAFTDNQLDTHTVRTEEPKSNRKRINQDVVKALQTTPTTVQMDYSMTTDEEQSIEHQEKSLSSSQSEQKLQQQDLDWLIKVKDAFGAFSEAFHGGVKTPMFEPQPQGNQTLDVFAVVSSQELDIPHIRRIVKTQPELFIVKESSTGRLPLHQLCAKFFPDRSKLTGRDYTDALTHDILDLKTAISLVTSANEKACKCVDKFKDLASHLAARNLMEWEASWYERVYQSAATDKERASSAEISKLYQYMSECIEILIRPIINSKDLLKLHGSIGCILPLHMATVFTLQVRTLRHILQRYPEAAHIPCDLKGIKSLIPDHLLPFELHNELSTDFPKWEIEASSPACPEIRWSQTKGTSTNLDDCILRSDLLFSFNPEVEPFSQNIERYKRFKDRIIFECQSLSDGDRKGLGKSCRLFWTWLSVYPINSAVSSIFKQIVGSTSLISLSYLLRTKTRCQKTVLEELDETRYSIFLDRLTVLLPPDKGVYATEPFENGFLCRKLFNIHEKGFPTSFVIVPGKIVKLSNGVHCLDHGDCQTGVPLDDLISELTAVDAILAALHLKSSKHYAMPLLVESFDVKGKYFSHQNDFIKHFGNGDGFLYFVDEASGEPLLSIPGCNEYPLHVKEAPSILRKVFPLMQMGLLLLNKKKVRSTILSVLTSEAVKVVMSSWKDLARSILQRSSRDSPPEEKIQTIKDLIQNDHRIERPKLPRSGISEWSVELGMLSLLLNDAEGLPSMLKPFDVGSGILCWYLPRASVGNEWETRVPQDEKPVWNLASKFDSLSGLHDEIGSERSNSVSRSSANSLESSSPLCFLKPHDDAVSLSLQLKLATGLGGSERSIATIDSTPSIEYREPTQMDHRMNNRATIVWQDLKHSLDHSNLIEDTRMTQLKVDMANEAKILSELGKRISSIRAVEASLHGDFSEEEDEDEIATTPNPVLRTLNLRLCDLESRILTNEIDLQHADLALFALEKELDPLVPKSANKKHYQRQVLIRSRLAQAKKRILAMTGTKKRAENELIKVAVDQNKKNRAPMPVTEYPTNNRKIELPFRNRSQRSPSPDRSALSPIPDFLPPLTFPELKDRKTTNSPYPSDESASSIQTKQSSKKGIDWIHFDSNTGRLEL